MGKSWELTDDQKKEVEENTNKMLEEWKKKQEGSSDTEDAEQGDSRQERERTDDEDIR